MITVNGEPLAWWPGMTVADILREKKYTFTALIVSVNGGRPLSEEDYAACTVSDGDSVAVLHLVAGG
ncbi:MAG: sulfur carrier protein ThiS [Negativicutes bacterium]|nr:sulfur carrier protein ThiS [Negativicutes bacterium]